jgi:hypothetical protein
VDAAAYRKLTAGATRCRGSALLLSLGEQAAGDDHDDGDGADEDGRERVDLRAKA